MERGPALSKIANVHTVGGIVFRAPARRDQGGVTAARGLLAGYRKVSRRGPPPAERGGAEGLTFELLNRNVDQPYKFVGIFLVDQWSKIGVHATQKVLPTGLVRRDAWRRL